MKTIEGRSAYIPSQEWVASNTRQSTLQYANDWILDQIVNHDTVPTNQEIFDALTDKFPAIALANLVEVVYAAKRMCRTVVEDAVGTNPKMAGMLGHSGWGK